MGTIWAANSTHGLHSFVILAFPVALALFDTSLVVVSRLLTGRPVQLGGQDHFSHRLRLLGWSPYVILAATVWGVGVCYMWPTMLAAASERFPRGGALLMGLMGTGGTLSIYFVLPQMGKIFDVAKIRAAGGDEAFKALSGDKLNEVLTYASQYSFRVVAILPAILLVVFGGIWLYDKARGGYKPEKIASKAAVSK